MKTPCQHPDDAALLFAARDYVTREDFTVRRCARCGVAFTAPAPADVGRYYPAAYYGTAGQRRFPAIVEWLQARLYGRRAATVEALAGGAGRVLDVGCGPGRLLQAFARRGWQIQGTELSEASAAHPRARGIPVHVGALDSAGWAPGSFDAAVMWHVLEHWPDPAVPIAEVSRLLRPGGVFAIGVPNFASPEARLTRAGWFNLDVPRHLVHLGPGDLERLLAAEGFEVRRWSHLAPEFDAFSFVQSVENALGMPHNLLYGFLRTPGARLASGSAVATLLALGLAVPLTLVALPVTLTATLLRRGTSVTAYAVKVR